MKYCRLELLKASFWQWKIGPKLLFEPVSTISSLVRRCRLVPDRLFQDCTETDHFAGSVTGSFKSTALYLLAFDPIGRTLEVTSTTPAEGPHQYLALNEARDRVYATTWGMPPTLSSWAVEKDSGAPTLRHVNSVSISQSTAPVQFSALSWMQTLNFASHPMKPRHLRISRCMRTDYILQADLLLKYTK